MLPLLLLPLVPLACGNDFDSLFPADVDAGKTRASDSGTVRDDDAGTVVDSGSPIVEDSGGGGGTGVLTCKEDNRCDQRCARGATCDIQCFVEDTCDLGCDGCNSTFNCGAENCAVACTGAATCNTLCRSETCTMRCSPESSCALRCDGRVKICNLDCQGGEKRICEDGVYTCNQPCF